MEVQREKKKQNRKHSMVDEINISFSCFNNIYGWLNIETLGCFVLQWFGDSFYGE